MNLFNKIRASLQFTEVSIGCFGFSVTFCRDPKPGPALVKAPVPRDTNTPWLFGVGGLLLGAALAAPNHGGGDDGWL